MKKENQKEILYFDSFKIQVCKDLSLQPFLNVFHFKGEHIDQEKNGEIFGIIQTSDLSEQSSYLPNIISQALKKGFFSVNQKRSPQPIELALHKANSELANLVQQGSAQWIGNLNAAIGSFKDDNFSFSQTGTAKIFFIRKKKITEITEGMSTENENPLKTFSNVSSGTIEMGDKIIFCTDAIHKSLSVEDLGRHLNAFSSDEFDNILASTLKSEGDNVGAIVVNIRKREIQNIEVKKKKTGQANYFGTDNKESGLGSRQERQLLREKERAPKTKTENEISENNRTETLVSNNSKMKKWTGDETQEGDGSAKAPHETKKESGLEEACSSLSPFEKQPELFINDQEGEEIERKIEQSNSFQKKFASALEHLSMKRFFNKNKAKKVLNRIEISGQEPQKKWQDDKKKKSGGIVRENFLTEDEHLSQTKNQNETIGKIEDFWRNRSQRSFAFLKTIFSTFVATPGANLQKKAADIKKGSLKKNLLLGMLALAVFLFFALAIGNLAKKHEAQNNSANQVENGASEQKNAENKKSGNTEHFEKLLEFQDEVSQLAADNGRLYVFSSQNKKIFYEYDIRNGSKKDMEIADVSNQQKYEVMVAMDVLNLIFFLSKNNLVSYNRVTGNFESHNIGLPENMEMAGIETKGTYLYLLDKASGQIYRYPRSEGGGFGAPKLWLASQADLSKATDIAVDDSIYIAYSDGKIEKYFKSKLEKTFLLEENEKIIAHKISTIDDYPFYYVLDNENGIAAKVKKDGNSIEKIFKSELLIEAKDIYLESENKYVFLLTRENQLFRLRE